MAELEPTPVRAPQDERDKVAKLQRELERAQVDVNRKEAFGKYDVTVPNEGELSYQDYLDQRPAEGIVRDGDTLRDAESGNFASEAAYGAQKSTNEDYYATVETTSFNGEKYESMGVMQLAKEAAIARREGNSSRELLVKEALENHLTIDAMKDETESDEEAQARFDSEVTRYEQLVDRFLARPDNSSQQSDQAHAEPNGEGLPSQRAAGESVAELAVAAVVADPSEVSPDEVKAEPVEPKEPGAYFNGRKVSITRHFKGFDPNNREREALEVVDDETGDILLVNNPTDVIYQGPSTTKATGEAEPAKPGKELELYSDPAKGKELELYTGELEEAPKKWWQKVGESVRKRAGMAYWAAKFETFRFNASEKWDSYLNWHVDPEASVEEKEKKRQKNRVIATLARGAIAVAAIAGGAYLLSKGVTSGGSGGGADHVNNASSVGLGEHSAWTQQHPGMGHDLGHANEGVTNLPLDVGSGPGVESIAEAPAIAPELFTASAGEGGLQLFKNLGLDSTVWYEHARSLVEQFPQDFYLQGTDVRISHSGALSQGAQEFINSLRQG